MPTSENSRTDKDHDLLGTTRAIYGADFSWDMKTHRNCRLIFFFLLDVFCLDLILKTCGTVFFDIRLIA